jgi:hypothetical protein
METNGEQGKVSVSQTTYDLLKDDAAFTLEPRGKVEAKGKGEIDMYFVTLSIADLRLPTTADLVSSPATVLQPNTY